MSYNYILNSFFLQALFCTMSLFLLYAGPFWFSAGTAFEMTLNRLIGNHVFAVHIFLPDQAAIQIS